MALLASTIINRARDLLIDTGEVYRWSNAEMLRYLSDAQRTIVAIDPSANGVRDTVQLVAGTRQSLPSDAQMLLNIYRNMGAAGTTPGRAIRVVLREILDTQNPDWHSETKQNTVYNYTYDPVDETEFFVYPPSTGNNQVEVLYSKIPDELTELTDTLELSEKYATPLLDYVMYRAHQKDSDFAAGQGLAGSYLQAFQLYMQAKGGSEKEVSPNLGAVGYNPQVTGAAR